MHRLARLRPRLASLSLLHRASPPSLRLPQCSTQLRHRSTASEDDVHRSASTSEDDGWVNGAPQALVDLDPAREARFREVYDEIARGKLISNEDLRVGLEAAVPGSTGAAVDSMSSIGVKVNEDRSEAPRGSGAPKNSWYANEKAKKACARTHARDKGAVAPD